MKAAINIEGPNVGEAVAVNAAAIIELLRVGHELRTPETLMSQALGLLRLSAIAPSIHIEGCDINGDDKSMTHVD